MMRFARSHRLALSGVALLVLGAAACAPALGKPALRQVPNVPAVWDSSDPEVFVYGGTTYLFGSTNNKKVPVRVITSYTDTIATSEAQWKDSGIDAMPERPAWVDPTEWEIWAPSVARLGLRYFMYFAAKNVSATTDEVNDQCIGRAVATSPMGPYRPEPSPLYCGYPAEGPAAGMPASNAFGRGALDPEVIRGADGVLYLLMALSRTTDNIGVVKLASDGTVVGGRNAKPTILASQSMPWHDGTDDATRKGGFLENPTMVYEPSTKTYLLFFSAGAWNTANYNTSFARCEAPMGECTQDTRGPFLKSGDARSGPGGMTAYVGATGELRVAYATWELGHEATVFNPFGMYSRQTHWNVLRVTATSDPAKQSVWLA
ncbi:MAG: family 43 glycosylhydrolase [Acidimicrobiales bacterium]